MNDVVALTQQLVRLPSVSGNEQACVELLTDLLPNARVSRRNVWASKGEGKTLLLNSHTDTVPDSAEWTRDPWDGALENGKVRGLGSNDAKGPLAALVIAFLTTEVNGRLVLAATCDEEIGGHSASWISAPPIRSSVPPPCK